MKRGVINIIDIIKLVFLLSLAACATAAVIIFKAPILTILLYFTGILYYILYITAGTVDQQINSDYIQTGEAAVGLFAIFIIMRFITNETYVLIILTFICIVFYEIYIKLIISPKKNELLINGIFIQAVIAVIIYYLLMNDTTFNIITLEKVFCGYLNSIPMGAVHFIILLVPFLASALLLMIFRHELRTFSFGESFFNITGFNHTFANLLLLILRSMLMTLMIFLLGWLGGTGYYLRKMHAGKFAQARSYLTIIIYTQVLILLTLFFNRWHVIALAAVLSYFSFIFYNKKRAGIYDRYQ